MFLMEFDHELLDSLPVADEEAIQRVAKILKSIVARRVIPYFRKHRGTDAIAVARVGDHLNIERLDDPVNRIHGVSFVTRTEKGWTIHLHERVYDYLIFVIPSNPDARLGDGTPEERKVLAMAEFILRHEIDHILYPDHTERQVLEADAHFAMLRRETDPTFYRALRDSLADELNGLKGASYIWFFNHAEQELGFDNPIAEIMTTFGTILGDFPENLIQQVFPLLDVELKTKVLGTCFRRSRETAYPLFKRTSFLERLLRLFEILLGGDPGEAQQVFETFKEMWGLVYLLQELGIPQSAVEGKDARQIFELFKESLTQFLQETKELFPTVPPKTVIVPIEPKAPPPPVKTLKDRIEEARTNPNFPPQVVEAIEKNKLNAVGHSGSKYSEFIETLLAIPWGTIREVRVAPEEFEQGLERSHFGLIKPKEIICDFFTNLIWRYEQFSQESFASWKGNGSAFLFVGPPGVGKTSLAISIATNLQIPYHKISLGGMRDEADLKGHGFTYEGSKPGAIVQGLIKMGMMNGMYILDEADKTEKFAISTLLEILDPEQNHLFHDKYSQTTIDIDLSNAHFILTANTLETVPAPVINRCEVVLLDRYSVEEKISIGRDHLMPRLRSRYRIPEDRIFFDPDTQNELLRFLIKHYTHEAGVRELERLIRTLFLRIFRKDILTRKHFSVRITRERIKQYLELPRPPRLVNEDDRVGEMMALGINVDLGIGSLIPIQATVIRGDGDEGRHGSLSMVHATGNIQKIMDESRKVASTAILHCAEPLGIELQKARSAVHLHFMAGSTPKDGPSAGGAIALALASVLSAQQIRRDVAMTGEIDTQGRITQIGGLAVKLETAADAGCTTVIIPKENLLGEDGIERLSAALRDELQVLTFTEWQREHEPFDHHKHLLQVVAVEHIAEAAEVARIDPKEMEALETAFVPHARSVAKALALYRGMPEPCFTVVYVKDVSELGPDPAAQFFWSRCGAVLLVRPDLEESVREAFAGTGVEPQVWVFDPKLQPIDAMFGDMGVSLKTTLLTSERLSLVAPYFFLRNQKESLDRFYADSGATLVLMANNYTAVGRKIKSMKPILNRVYHYLAQLGPEHLDACPFLVNLDGIYVANLAYISEKYRLDVKRAEKILSTGLEHWLAVVEGALKTDRACA